MHPSIARISYLLRAGVSHGIAIALRIGDVHESQIATRYLLSCSTPEGCYTSRLLEDRRCALADPLESPTILYATHENRFDRIDFTRQTVPLSSITPSECPRKVVG